MLGRARDLRRRAVQLGPGRRRAAGATVACCGCERRRPSPNPSRRPSRRRRASRRIVSRYATLAAVSEDPLSAVIGLGYGLAVAIAAGYMALTIVGAMVLSAERRTRDLAYLRALGFSIPQALGLTVSEHAPPVLLALVPGIGLGIGIAMLSLPGLGLGTFVGAGGQVPLFIDWAGLGLLALALVGVVTVAVAAGHAALRARPARRRAPVRGQLTAMDRENMTDDQAETVDLPARGRPGPGGPEIGMPEERGTQRVQAGRDRPPEPVRTTGLTGTTAGPTTRPSSRPTRALVAVPGGAQILCEGVVKIYKVADLEVVALQGLDLLVEAGEFVALDRGVRQRQEHAHEHPRRPRRPVGRPRGRRRPRPRRHGPARSARSTGATSSGSCGSRRPGTCCRTSRRARTSSCRCC